MEEMVYIPMHVFSTLHPEGYAERFWHFVQASAMNHREAWSALEDERTTHGLPERYSSYESFRAARCAARSEKGENL
jgi:hypothetical protein